MVNFTVEYLGTRGGSVEHRAGCDCTATSTLPQYFRDGEENFPGLDGTACTDLDIRLVMTPVTGDLERLKRWIASRKAPDSDRQ